MARWGGGFGGGAVLFCKQGEREVPESEQGWAKKQDSGNG